MFFFTVVAAALSASSLAIPLSNAPVTTTTTDVATALSWTFDGTATDTPAALASSTDHVSLRDASVSGRKRLNITCQECLRPGADVDLAFDVDLVSASPESCLATLLINQVALVLPRQSVDVPVVVPSLISQDLYHLRVESSCGEHVDGHSNDWDNAIEVNVRLVSVNAQPVRAVIGFLTTTLDGTISVRALGVKSLEGGAVEVNRPVLNPSSNCVFSCETLRTTTASTARYLGRKLGQALDCVLVTMGRTIGNAGVTQYRTHVQSVVASMTEADISKNEKVALEIAISQLSDDQGLGGHSASVSESEQQDAQATNALLNTLVRILEVIVGAIGLSTLVAIIKKRCCSLRRRVERLADREERTKANEYRRAARQEARRKRWERLRRSFLCCCAGIEPSDVDEEKQALVGAAADMSSTDQAMSAHGQLNGMLYLYDAAHTLTRARTSMQYQNRARSRSSSLPSYHSEVLPGYSTEPDSDFESRRQRNVAGFGPRALSPSSSRCTPYSSVPALSARHSSETLRTDLSFE